MHTSDAATDDTGLDDESRYGHQKMHGWPYRAATTLPLSARHFVPGRPLPQEIESHDAAGPDDAHRAGRPLGTGRVTPVHQLARGLLASHTQSGPPA